MADKIPLKKLYPDLSKFKGDYNAINKVDIVLVGTPLHRNLGDHLIAESEKHFLHDTFPNSRLFEIPTEVFLKNFKFIEKHTPKDTRVFITGGGWMGNLWPKDELAMQQMIKTFSHCRITILPQTIYYDDANDHTLLESSRAVMSCCEDIKLCTRDAASFAFAKKYLGVEQLTLAPDMSLYYESEVDNDKWSAGICLRNDREKVESDNVDILKQQLEFEFNIRDIDTISPEPVAIYDRREKIYKALREFASCPVVLTDRLQAMIFSVIVGTKCIALSNKTGKVAGIYDKWLKWDENIMLADANLDFAEVERFICAPYKTTHYAERLQPEFDKLKKFIKE